jgi:hypothetical protein
MARNLAQELTNASLSRDLNPRDPMPAIRGFVSPAHADPFADPNPSGTEPPFTLPPPDAARKAIDANGIPNSSMTIETFAQQKLLNYADLSQTTHSTPPHSHSIINHSDNPLKKHPISGIHFRRYRQICRRKDPLLISLPLWPRTENLAFNIYRGYGRDAAQSVGGREKDAFASRISCSRPDRSRARRTVQAPSKGGQRRAVSGSGAHRGA